MWFFKRSQPQWACDMEARIRADFKQGVKAVMDNANDSAAKLAAEEAVIEQKVTALGVAEKAAFADLKAQLTDVMSKNGVPADQVDAVTAKMTAFESVIDSLTAAATAADPGPVPVEAPAPPVSGDGSGRAIGS